MNFLFRYRISCFLSFFSKREKNGKKKGHMRRKRRSRGAVGGYFCLLLMLLLAAATATAEAGDDDCEKMKSVALPCVWPPEREQGVETLNNRQNDNEFHSSA